MPSLEDIVPNVLKQETCSECGRPIYRGQGFRIERGEASSLSIGGYRLTFVCKSCTSKKTRRRRSAAIRDINQGR